MKTEILVEQMKAAAESAHLEKTLEAVPGVESVEVNSGEQKIVVEHSNVDASTLIAALSAAGYARAKPVG